MTLNFNFNGHRPLKFLFIRDKSDLKNLSRINKNLMDDVH